MTRRRFRRELSFESRKSRGGSQAVNTARNGGPRRNERQATLSQIADGGTRNRSKKKAIPSLVAVILIFYFFVFSRRFAPSVAPSENRAPRELHVRAHRLSAPTLLRTPCDSRGTLGNR
jgi:hypothetical protein